MPIGLYLGACLCRGHFPGATLNKGFHTSHLINRRGNGRKTSLRRGQWPEILARDEFKMPPGWKIVFRRKQKKVKGVLCAARPVRRRYFLIIFRRSPPTSPPPDAEENEYPPLLPHDPEKATRAQASGKEAGMKRGKCWEE